MDRLLDEDAASAVIYEACQSKDARRLRKAWHAYLEERGTHVGIAKQLLAAGVPEPVPVDDGAEPDSDDDGPNGLNHVEVARSEGDDELEAERVERVKHIISGLTIAQAAFRPLAGGGGAAAETAKREEHLARARGAIEELGLNGPLSPKLTLLLSGSSGPAGPAGSGAATTGRRG